MTTLQVLQQIARDNYVNDFGTYDYDGIAESLFNKIEELKKHE